MSPVFMCYFKILTFYVIFESTVSDDGSENEIGRNFALQLVKPHTNFTVTAQLPNCVQENCKVNCSSGQIDQLEKSIQAILPTDNTTCRIIEQLRLYNIEFPERNISYGFLGNYSARVRSLYIGASNVTDIGFGAFGKGIFEHIFLENLQLVELHKDIFKNVANIFQAFTVIQHFKPVQSVSDDFLSHIKYQIKKLTLQVGLPNVRNVTASSSLLNNLKYVDLSHNNFTDTFTDETYQKLWVVEFLDLSHSKIQFLPNYIFSQLTDSLTYLNLSNNHLLAINHLIFGRHSVNKDLIIDAHSNPWNCSCELRMEMSMLLRYQSNYPTCQTPEKYESLSVLDNSLCPGLFDSTQTDPSIQLTTRNAISTTNWNKMSYILETNATTNSTPKTDVNTETTPQFQTSPIIAVAAVGPSNVTTARLRCLSPGGETVASWRKVLLPDPKFVLTPLTQLRVEVSLEVDNSGKSYGLLWFNNIVDDYYRMSVNYNQYGLGCILPISYTSIIEELTPDTSYTFCLVDKDQLTIPPFNCKSLHLSSNLDTKYNAWLTHDMRPTGISLTVLGVVFSCFVGILVVYIILKQQPILLRGSKRIQMTNNYSKDIIIFPKEHSLEDLKMKEQTLAKCHTRSTKDATTENNTLRRNSTVSVESNQSYMNTANLYEVIPAYLRLQDMDRDYEKISMEFESINSYVLPLASKCLCCDTDLVSYAKVTPHSKRASNDPLPALPLKQTEPKTATTSNTSIVNALYGR